MAEVIAPDQLRAELKEGIRRPVYLLAGADGFRAERAARWIAEQSLDPSMAEFNRESLYADEVTPAKIASAAAAFPMFGGQRVVWVRHAEALATGAAMDPLLDYVKNPSDATVLIFTSGKLDKRLKFTSACAERGRVVEFARLTGSHLVQAVRRQAKEHEVDLTSGAVEALIELVGEELGEIDQELAKLSLQEGSAGSIDEDAVRSLVGRSRDVNAFWIADQLDPRSPQGALAEWWELRRGGGDSMGCAAVLAWRLRQLTQLRAALDEGLDPQQAARRCGLAPWQARRVLPLAQSTSQEALTETLEAWRAADRRAKSSSLGGPLAYDLALLHWAGGVS